VNAQAASVIYTHMRILRFAKHALMENIYLVQRKKIILKVKKKIPHHHLLELKF
jgi:hypothetical protein